MFIQIFEDEELEVENVGYINTLSIKLMQLVQSDDSYAVGCFDFKEQSYVLSECFEDRDDAVTALEIIVAKVNRNGCEC